MLGGSELLPRLLLVQTVHKQKWPWRRDLVGRAKTYRRCLFKAMTAGRQEDRGRGWSRIQMTAAPGSTMDQRWKMQLDMDTRRVNINSCDLSTDTGYQHIHSLICTVTGNRLGGDSSRIRISMGLCAASRKIPSRGKPSCDGKSLSINSQVDRIALFGKQHTWEVTTRNREEEKKDTKVGVPVSGRKRAEHIH
ncbi:hypothetical protein VTN77DRAFT_8942 [Rasamsonia byssochlamydoides]|uniref:uncharacterized protein n=1 Tax=Rasamsonia byssochlamydoides TaxID=89139 RepID=UPI0037437BFD